MLVEKEALGKNLARCTLAKEINLFVVSGMRNLSAIYHVAIFTYYFAIFGCVQFSPLKRLISFFITICLGFNLSAQDYTLSPTNLNSQGNPTDLLLSTVLVTNTSANNITMKVERIIKNLPPNWTSCFCFPTCVAPFIDTISFQINPFSTDSVKPNFGTDSIPGIGYVTITLYQQGFSNKVDTVTFSGSTLSATGISDDEFKSNLKLFPNPFRNSLSIQNKNSESFSIEVFSSTGQVVFINGQLSSTREEVNLESLSDGLYYVIVKFSSGRIISESVIKSTE